MTRHNCLPKLQFDALSEQSPGFFERVVILKVNMKFILLFLFTFSASQFHWIDALEKALCIESAFHLSCANGYLLQILNLRLGDSNCYKTNCCPRDQDCLKPTSYDHKNHVNSICNGQQSCRFNVEKRNIGCVWYAPNNDYEIVTYDCIRDPKFTSIDRTSSSLAPSPRDDLVIDVAHIPVHGLAPPEVKSNETTGPADLSFTTPEMIVNAQQLQQNSVSGESAKEYKFVNLETIVIPAIAGLIITALIISVACIVTKNIKLKYLRQKNINQDHNLTGIYLQPISYQTLMRSCTDELPHQEMNPCNQECSNGCDTYDSIKDVCASLEDGYLKPADIIGESSQQKIQEEDRYVIA